MLKVEDVLEILSIPLLGIIPESQEVLRASNLGSPVTLSQRRERAGPGLSSTRRGASRARPWRWRSRATARRLFGKLFGRRAA